MSYAKKRQTIEEIYDVQLQLDNPGFVRNNRTSGARWQGIKYERKAQEHFTEVYGRHYIESPWLHYQIRQGKRLMWKWCQPDAIVFIPDQGSILIIEYKYRHTADAWYQLVDLYSPVLSALFPNWKLTTCEVCKWYDRDISTPQAPRLVKKPELTRINEFGVHIWTP